MDIIVLYFKGVVATLFGFGILVDLKVAMITRDYPPTIGGIATHTYSLVKHLRKIGVDADVFAGVNDFKTTLLPFSQTLRSSSYDLIHVQSSPYGALATRHPLVITVHSSVREEGKYYSLRNGLKTPLAYFLEKVSFTKADAIIAVSTATRNELVQNYGLESRKISLIENGVDCDIFTPNKRSGFPPKILMCSRLDPRKNIMQMLVVLSSLGQHAYEFIVVGEGPERGRLEDFARRKLRNTIFLGAIDQERLHEIFAQSDIFVSTSRSEGFGLSVLQAMASGCAVLVSNIPSHRELVTHLRDGLIYSSQEELTSSLESLMCDPKLVMRLGAKARERALSLSWRRAAEKTAALYQELIARR